MVLLGHLIRLSRFKFTLFIMYQLMVETSSDALIDPEYNIREFLNGKVVRLAVFHVIKYIDILLDYLSMHFVTSLIIVPTFGVC